MRSPIESSAVLHRRFHHGVTDSTNERAFAAIDAGRARHGDLHVAHGQTSGRGRLGRRWHSESGVGLYISVVLLPPVAPPPAALTVAGGLAVLDAVRGLGLAKARLEWPNDVVAEVGGGKLAGVLVETRGFDPGRPCYVLGIGLNVAQRSFPGELRRERSVTSLALEQVEVSVPEAELVLLDRLAPRLDQVQGGPELLARDYVEACGLAHGSLRASSSGAEVRGELLRFSLVEGITLRDEHGATARIALEFLRALEHL